MRKDFLRGLDANISFLILLTQYQLDLAPYIRRLLWGH